MATGRLSKVVERLRSVLDKQDAAGLADGDLLKRYVQQRDEAAFEALVRRHGPMVLGVCRRVLHHSHDAEDAFQATFLVLLRKASTLRSPGMIGNWLYGVAYRTALHARDTAIKRRAKEAKVVPHTQTPEETWTDLQLVLDQEVERLPDRYRAVVALCDLEGKTRKEAAQHLGWPEGTVASRLASARAMMAKRLARQGFGVSGGALAAILSHSASACVPASVMTSTIKATSLFAAGETAEAGLISLSVAALTEGVLKAMLVKKLKNATAVLVVLALIGGVGAGVAMLTHKAVATNQVQTKTDIPEKPTGTISRSRSIKGEYEFLSLSLSRDGKKLATITMDAGVGPGDFRAKNAVRLWDFQVESVKRTLAEDPIKNRCYASYAGVGLSPDGKIVAAPAYGKYAGENGLNWLVLWDAETGKIRHKLKHFLEVRALAFSPDGKTVATGTGGNTDRDFETVKVWEAQTGKLQRTLQTTNKGAVKVVFAPDSKLLAAVLHQAGVVGGAPAEVILWNPGEAKPSPTLPDSEDIEAIAFSAGGKTLLGATRTKLRVWDVATGKAIQGLELNTGFSNEGWSAIAFSPDGKTFAVAGKQEDKHVIALYDVKTAKRTKTLEGHAGLIHLLSFSPDSNTLASGGFDDQTIYLWDFDRGTKLEK